MAQTKAPTPLDFKHDDACELGTDHERTESAVDIYGDAH